MRSHLVLMTKLIQRPARFTAVLVILLLTVSVLAQEDQSVPAPSESVEFTEEKCAEIMVAYQNQIKADFPTMCVENAYWVTVGLPVGTDYQTASLRGIGGYRVVVEGMTTDALDIGLRPSRVQTKVELALRSAGIPVLPEEDNSAPYIYVNINVTEAAFNIGVRVKRETVFTAEGRLYETFGAVWTTAFAGTHGKNPEFILDSLQGLLDQLLNDHLKVNPKR